MKFSDILACCAAAVLVMAPIAAHAGTRAGDASVPLAQSFDRGASPIQGASSLANDDDDDDDDEGLLWILLFGGVSLAIILLSGGSSENDASSGTGG